jgi:hypothetical protein
MYMHDVGLSKSDLSFSQVLRKKRRKRDGPESRPVSRSCVQSQERERENIPCVSPRTNFSVHIR